MARVAAFRRGDLVAVIGTVSMRRLSTHIYVVTDSEEAFAEMRSELPRRERIGMLYRDYLRLFRINTERNR